MNKADYILGTLAFVGFTVWVLSLIYGLVHELVRLWHWLTGTTGGRHSVKIAVEEMYDTTPYASARNAKQQITRKGRL